MKKIRVKIILTGLLFILLLYLFWGPLFPWSPLKPGFKKITSARATIYIKDITPSDEAIYNLDKIISEAETWHGLKYNHKFRVVVTEKNSNMKRFCPWLKGSGYSVILGRANLIYIGPTQRKSAYSLETYLKHEFSHLLLYQNTHSFKKAYQQKKQGWLSEGLATYFGGPDFYTDAEMIELSKIYNIRFNSLNEADPFKMPREEIRLRYDIHRSFIEFLIITYGLEKLQTYTKKYIHSQSAYKELFKEVFSKDLSDILYDFDTYIHTMTEQDYHI